MSNLKNCSDPQDVRVREGIVLPQKGILLLLSFITFVAIFISCGPSKQEMEFRETSAKIANSLAEQMPDITTDTIDGLTHNFVKTADIKCRVTNVISSTEAIKNSVKKHGGYLTKSELLSHTDYSRSVQAKKDSVLQLNFYTTTNTIILRVPARALDTLLSEIRSLAVFINHSAFNADDVKMKMYSNVLSEKRYDTFKKSVRQNIKTASEKLTPLIAVEEQILQKQALTDEVKISGYELGEHVNYGTITVELYQAQQLEQTLAVNLPDIEGYHPTFVERLKTAGSKSLESLGAIVIFLVKTWPVLLLLLLVYLFYRRNRTIKTNIPKIS